MFSYMSYSEIIVILHSIWNIASLFNFLLEVN